MSNQKSQIISLKFEISDIGPGIPEDRLEDIFSPFVQIGDHARERKGTGLGLAISRRLAQMMGGSLTVESSEGQGSTFRCTIPFPVLSGSASAAPEGQQLQRRYGDTGPRRTILIADDNPSNRAMLADLLRPLGFIITEAVDGQDALPQLEEMRPKRPDLLLLDLVMPRLDGLLERRYYHLRLEWQHDRSSSSTPEPLLLVFPEQKELEALITLAKCGYVTDLRQTLDLLSHTDPRFVPFCARLKEMINAFRFEGIIAFQSDALREEP